MRLLDRLNDLAVRQGSRDAVVSETGRIDYVDLAERVQDGVTQLRRMGISPGTVVGLSVSDETTHLLATLSLLALGARQATLATFEPRLAQETMAKRIGVTSVVSAEPGSSDLIVDHIDTESGRPGDADEGVIFLRTSGTTGEANITEVSAAQLDLQNGSNPSYSAERLLSAASIEQNIAKRHRLYALLAGGTNVMRAPHEHDLIAFANRYGVTRLDISPVHAAGLVESPNVGQLRNVLVRIGGAPTSLRLRKSLLRTVPPPVEVRYGTTECGTIAISQIVDEGVEAVGRPGPRVVVEIVDAEGRPCREGDVGFVRIRSPGMALGYYNSREQSEKRFRDGWFWPGDMGRILSDGRLVLEGRADDMMMLNGINIFPAEIERVLESHPDVASAAAMPLPSRVHGQIPVAAVELRHGAVVSEGELKSFARERLALRSPRRIAIFDAFPRNEQGKILKREILNSFQGRGSSDGSA